MKEAKSKGKPMRALRKMNERRMLMVQAFVEEFEANPSEYADYGSDEWINSMIKYFRDPRSTRIFPQDIKSWLATEAFFEGLNRKYGFEPLSPVDHSSHSEPEISESCEKPMEAEMEGTVVENVCLCPATMTIKVVEGTVPSSPSQMAGEPSAVIITQPAVMVTGTFEVVQGFTRFLNQTQSNSAAELSLLPFTSATPQLLHHYATKVGNIITDFRNAGYDDRHRSLEGCSHASKLLQLFSKEDPQRKE